VETAPAPLQKTRSQDPQTPEKEESVAPEEAAQTLQNLQERTLPQKIQTQHPPMPQKNQKTQKSQTPPQT
jgi:hypothetical protein